MVTEIKFADNVHHLRAQRQTQKNQDNVRKKGTPVAVHLIADGGASSRFTRWMMRDFAIFLYGCIFACKYAFLGQKSRWLE